MKTVSNYPKSNAHAATTRVSAAEGENLAVSGNSSVNSVGSQVNVSPGTGLVWDEATSEAFETIRQVIWNKLAKYGLCQYAEDVYQETYLKAFHSSSKFQPSKGEIGAWFRGIASHAANDCIREVLTNRACVQSLDGGLDVPDHVISENFLGTEHILRALSSAVGHHAAYERTLVHAFRYDGDTSATAEALGIPKRTIQWSQALVRKFGIVIARALTVRTAREERGKADDPVTVGELVWCLPSEVDYAAYVTLLSRVGSVDQMSRDDLVTLTGLSGTVALQYASEITRMLTVARSVVETGTITTSEEG